MEIKDYVKQFRDLQKSHKKVRGADFCSENMLDYYEMVEAMQRIQEESEKSPKLDRLGLGKDRC